MCYGSGCKWEKWSGECGKPRFEVCPESVTLCERCGEVEVDEEVGFCDACLELIDEEAEEEAIEKAEALKLEDEEPFYKLNMNGYNLLITI